MSGSGLLEGQSWGMSDGRPPVGEKRRAGEALVGVVRSWRKGKSLHSDFQVWLSG